MRYLTSSWKVFAWLRISRGSASSRCWTSWTVSDGEGDGARVCEGEGELDSPPSQPTPEIEIVRDRVSVGAFDPVVTTGNNGRVICTADIPADEMDCDAIGKLLGLPPDIVGRYGAVLITALRSIYRLTEFSNALVWSAFLYRDEQASETTIYTMDGSL
jgi:hypothetical protein